MKTIVAIDPGKYIGLVAVYETGKIKGFYEATTVEEALKFISQCSPEVLIMESFISNGGRSKDYTALEVIAIIKFMLRKSNIQIVMQSPSCQANMKVEDISSKHCVSALKHVMYFLKGKTKPNPSNDLSCTKKGVRWDNDGWGK